MDDKSISHFSFLYQICEDICKTFVKTPHFLYIQQYLPDISSLYNDNTILADACKYEILSKPTNTSF
jgi:hypothetical protein